MGGNFSCMNFNDGQEFRGSWFCLMKKNHDRHHLGLRYLALSAQERFVLLQKFFKNPCEARTFRNLVIELGFTMAIFLCILR